MLTQCINIMIGEIMTEIKTPDDLIKELELNCELSSSYCSMYPWSSYEHKAYSRALRLAKELKANMENEAKEQADVQIEMLEFWEKYGYLRKK